MDASIQKGLVDRVYEKRKAATLVLERQVRECLARGERTRIDQIVQQLCALLATPASTATSGYGYGYSNGSTNSNAKNGGLIGLAGLSIALGTECAPYLDFIVPPILACFTDPDNRVRYFACESFYNIVKVCKGEILVYFNEIFDVLSKLASDAETSVKNGAELVDRLLKDIVCESAPYYVSRAQVGDSPTVAVEGRMPLSSTPATALELALDGRERELEAIKTFSLARFVPLLSERIHAVSPFTRDFLVSWITVLDSIPQLELVSFLADFLEGLFRYLDDANQDLRTSTAHVLDNFLDEIKDNARRRQFTLTHSRERKQGSQGSASPSPPPPGHASPIYRSSTPPKKRPVPSRIPRLKRIRPDSPATPTTVSANPLEVEEGETPTPASAPVPEEDAARADEKEKDRNKDKDKDTDKDQDKDKETAKDEGNHTKDKGDKAEAKEKEKLQGNADPAADSPAKARPESRAAGASPQQDASPNEAQPNGDAEESPAKESSTSEAQVEPRPVQGETEAKSEEHKGDQKDDPFADVNEVNADESDGSDAPPASDEDDEEVEEEEQGEEEQGAEDEDWLGSDDDLSDTETQPDGDEQWFPGREVHIDYAAIVCILIRLAREENEDILATSLQWISDFLEIVQDVVVPFTPELLPVLLPLIAHPNATIRETANKANLSLFKVIQDLPNPNSTPAEPALQPPVGQGPQAPSVPLTRTTTAQKPSSASRLMSSGPTAAVSIKSPDSPTAGVVSLDTNEATEEETTVDLFDWRETIDALAQVRPANWHDQTRVTSLEWLMMLHRKAPGKFLALATETVDGHQTYTLLLQTLRDPSDEVVETDLRLLAQLSHTSASASGVAGGGINETYFRMFMADLMSLFVSDRQFLDARGSLIVRQLCLKLHPERVLRALAEILEREEDLDFASHMVQNLNFILITSPELGNVRRRLRTVFEGTKDRDALNLFVALFKSWSHNSVAAFSLCLLAQAYEQASNLLGIFASEFDLSVSLLVQVDKLIQLLESPIFTYLRLQLLEPERYPYLSKCLYGLLMLLPQSSAFSTLRSRLSAVPTIGMPTPAPRSSYAASYAAATRKEGIKWTELLAHFRAIQVRHERAAKSRDAREAYATQTQSRKEPAAYVALRVAAEQHAQHLAQVKQDQEEEREREKEKEKEKEKEREKEKEEEEEGQRDEPRRRGAGATHGTVSRPVRGRPKMRSRTTTASSTATLPGA